MPRGFILKIEVCRRHHEWQLLDYWRTTLRRRCPRGCVVLRLEGWKSHYPSQRKSLLEHEIVVVWSLDKVVLMALSKVLNKKSEERDAKSNVQSQIVRARQNWHL